MKAYYEARAPEYDDWYLGRGRFAERVRPGWDDELAELTAAIERLPVLRTLDAACGTGFLTRHIPGEVVGLDQSQTMLGIAAARSPRSVFVHGDALAMPFDDGAFERIFAGHFYGHLEPEDRATFLAEARRVAGTVVIADSALRDDVEPEGFQQRVLNDGSTYEVYKRFFTPDALLDELVGGEVLHAGRWFVLVASHGA